MERGEGGPAAASVEAEGHPAGLEQVGDGDPFAQYRAEVVVRAAHDTRIAALGAREAGIRGPRRDERTVLRLLPAP